jgi:hypothetical protein
MTDGGDKSYRSFKVMHIWVGMMQYVSVADGQFDAGALKGKFTKLQRSGRDLVEVARFPNVTKPWIGGSDLNRRALL